MHQVKPFLDIALIDEFRLITFAFRGEKDVQVKFVKLAFLSNATDFLRHFIGKHDHARQGGIGVIWPLPRGFLTLFIRVCPVKHLLFDKLAAVDGAERRTGQEQIMIGRDGQESFVVGVVGFFLLVLLNVEAVVVILILDVEEFLGIFAPRTEVVLVEDHQVPIRRVHPFVLCLDTARVVGAEEVLKRAKAHDGTRKIGLFIGHSTTTNKLPAVEIHMSFEVFLPCSLHRWFEGEHKHTCCAHSLRQLI